MNEQITRSAGITTGYGYLVGSGYKGATQELDDRVVEIAEHLKDLYGKKVEIRFNSDRESGGGFIKDNCGDCTIGIGASLASSEFQSFTFKEKAAFPMEKYDDLVKDIIVYHVVLDDTIAKPGVDKWIDFNTLAEALKFLTESVEPMALQKYLEKI